MNDDFLHTLREPPRRDFAEDLYQQLSQLEEEKPMTTISPPFATVTDKVDLRRTSRSFMTLAAAIFALIMLGTVLFYTGRENPSLVGNIPISLHDLPPLTKENVGQLTEIKRLGNGSLNIVTWSPDGKTLAVAGARGVRLFDAADLSANPRLLEMRIGGRYGVQPRAAFSPDSRLIAANDGNTVRVMDAHTGAIIAVLEGHSSPVRALAFSPDGRFIASGSGEWEAETPDYSVRLWDLSTGKGRVIGEGQQAVREVVFSPDGQQIAAEFADETARVWNVENGTLQYTLSRKTNASVGLTFSPDGKLLALGEERGVGLWDAATGERIAEARVAGDIPPFVTDVIFTLDSEQVIFSTYNYGILVWDIPSRQYAHYLNLKNMEDVQSIRFSPEADLLALVDTNSILHLWDWTADQEVAAVRGYMGAIFGVSLHGTQAVYGKGNITEMRDLETGELLPAANNGLNFQNPTLQSFDDGRTYHFSTISPDGTILATSYDELKASAPSFVQLIDRKTGQVIHTLKHDGVNLIGQVAFSADGALLATTLDGQLYLWDVATGAQLFTTGPSANAAIAFDTEGRFIVTGGWDGLVRVWGVR